MKQKAWLIVLVLIVYVAAAVACSAGESAKPRAAAAGTISPEPKSSVRAAESSPLVEEIEGMYEFEDNVYTNPLSSFIAMKGYMPYFEISEDKLRIVDPQNDTVEEIAGKTAMSDIGTQDFEALFDNEVLLEGFSVPDIAIYSRCIQYGVYNDGYVEYRVYQMDDEVWLAKLSNGHMWSIYQLLKTGDVSVGIIGGADGPTSVYINRSAAD